MLLLLSWLRDFVEIRESPRELAHALTMAGMAVDGIEDADGETLFEFDITSNRPDAMNHFGMAREVASIYRRPLRRPAVKVEESAIPASSRASVAIEDTGSCLRYVGRVFTDVRVQPSPEWLRRRLELCGVRAINNLADLTNYVLLEMGQPTHAFDLDTLAGRRIVVRRAIHGESLVTLDGECRDLTPDQLAICDARKPVALAGVMGGAATEITSETRNVLLEAAWFRPAMVRNASRRFKLFTEASHRFERGADWDGAVWAADRIASLLGETGQGTVTSGRIDCYPQPRSLPTVRLERDRISRLLGVTVDGAEVEAILTSLGFRPVANGTGWSVPAVSHRLDVEREIDLIEEIARIYGFENIPGTLPPVGIAPTEAKLVAEEARIRADVRGLGYDETIGFSFISSKEARRFGGAAGVKLRNPLSRLWDVMRNSAVPTMVRALEWNLKRNQPLVRLAEFGRTYEKSSGGYQEPRILTLGASGTERPLAWNDPARPFGFYDIKADVATLLRPFARDNLRFDGKSAPAHYRRGHASAVRVGGDILAHFGELDPRIARERKIRMPVFVAEIFLDPVYKLGLRQPGHSQLPKVPAVSRDFSLLVPEGVRFESVAKAVGPMEALKSLEPVEVFRGKNLPPGCYSLLLRASWQRLDKSLTDDEVNAFADTLRSALETEVGIKART
jgi:phenylalanyl-tRNA synthetase beta chain